MTLKIEILSTETQVILTQIIFLKSTNSVFDVFRTPQNTLGAIILAKALLMFVHALKVHRHSIMIVLVLELTSPVSINFAYSGLNEVSEC